MPPPLSSIEPVVLNIETTPRKFAVTHVVLSLDVGGLERIVLDLIRMGREYGQEVSVICLERAGVLAQEAEALGAKILVAQKPPGLRLGFWKTLLPLLRELKPDILHTHQLGALFYASPVAAKLGIPVIHTEHNNHYSPRFRTRVLGRIAARRVERFCCVSQSIAEEVRHYRITTPDKIVVVPNGIHVNRFQITADVSLREQLGLTPQSQIVGSVARLCEQKRHDLLLEGFANVRKANPDAHLLIVGDGPHRSILQQSAIELGIAASTHFVGYQSKPERYLSIMDIFVLTSRYEGMPLSVLEAWAAGLPVIASAVGGLPEMIAGTGAGTLFPSGDLPALTKCLNDLLENPSQRKKMGCRGREIVQQSYSVQRMANDYHQLYVGSLERFGARPNE